jgi:hypothetical protein
MPSTLCVIQSGSSELLVMALRDQNPPSFLLVAWKSNCPPRTISTSLHKNAQIRVTKIYVTQESHRQITAC